MRKAFQFFFQHAGWVDGRRAIGAWSLARAERQAARAGWRAVWVADEDHDRGPQDWGAGKSEIERWAASAHECYGCVLQDETGTTLGSLWGIWDPDSDYRRVVAAELAAEALFEQQRAWGQTAHAH